MDCTIFDRAIPQGFSSTKCIFQSGVGAVSNCGFSHRSSVLADRNALRNPLRNMYQPSECLITVL